MDDESVAGRDRVGPDERVTSSLGHPGGGAWAAAVIAALGVVFGDIGTSPLYAFQTVFSLDHEAVGTGARDVYGVISLVFWSLLTVVTINYVTFVLRADNDGEGGVMALAALARRTLGQASGRRAMVVMSLGVFGASLFYGDSVITPAISVLSAVEGLNVAEPGHSSLILPAATTILAALFGVQRWGTSRVGHLFGPVMLLWFIVLAATGLPEIIADPAVLWALSPRYAVGFVVERPRVAFIAMGAVVLAITGAEALYADLGHFGRPPIRRAWFWLVFPALTVNYLAQGALVIRVPAARENPFFRLAPQWAQPPLVLLATAATIIASQAVISGAFSVSRQGVRLGFLPHLRVRHPAPDEGGQVYVPAVNLALFVGVLALLLGFRSSGRLAAAYGVAVTMTFLITTSLFLVLARTRWHWAVWKVISLGVPIGALEVTYAAANLTKVSHGGWLPLVVALGVFTLMSTWRRAAVLLAPAPTESPGLAYDLLHEMRVRRAAGPAVLVRSHAGALPLALSSTGAHDPFPQQPVIVVVAQAEDVPHIPWAQRLTVNRIGGDPGDGVIQITVRFGFQDRCDIPEALRRAGPELEGGLDPSTAWFYLSQPFYVAQPAMAAEGQASRRRRTWHKRLLFIVLFGGAARQAEELGLPLERLVVIRSRLQI